MIRKISFLCCLLLLCGCASLTNWSKLSGEFKDGSRKFQSVLPEGWKRYNLKKYFIATRDGIILEAISVHKLNLKTKLEYTKKQYFEGMTIYDLAEIEIDNFKSSNEITRFELVSNKPEIIDAQEGFCLEYSFYMPSGLKIQGIHYGFIYKEQVYRIRYEAPAQHYFKQYSPVFERFVNRFSLL